MKGLLALVIIPAVAVGVYYGMNYVPSALLPQVIARNVVDAQSMLELKPTQVATVTPTIVSASADASADGSTASFDGAVSEDEASSEGEMAETDDAEEAPESVAASPAAAGPAPGKVEEVEEAEEVEEMSAAKKSAAPASKAPAKPESSPEPAATASVPPPSADAPPPKPSRNRNALPEADSVKQWWPDPSSVPETQLKLNYAGAVQGQNAIALLFSSAVNLEKLQSHAAIRTESGDTVAGLWELAKNPRMAVFQVQVPGRYTVILEPGIADTRGYLLGMSLQGPVYIQP